MMLFLRSLLFYILLGLAVIGVVPLLLVCVVLPGTKRNRAIARWSTGVIDMLRVVCRVNYQVQGAENIPETCGIILSKHQSAWETFALQAIFPAQVWVLKRELLWVPIFGWGLKLMGAIAIDRKGGKKALVQVIKQGTDRLQRGLWLVIFPEGTRIAPGKTGHYSIGGAMLAARSGFPVVPVAHNAGEFWTKQGFIIKPGCIRVVIGPVLETKGMKAGEINEQVETWIEGQMKILSPEPAKPGSQGPREKQEKA